MVVCRHPQLLTFAACHNSLNDVNQACFTAASSSCNINNKDFSEEVQYVKFSFKLSFTVFIAVEA